ncbi:hypothetical protein VNO77_03212 [Canavalia gladiata]|uniref:Uncharacterized protein n=1 Tax=Canavalia gladiata TaxID=3824 RepID=A0AAN9MWC5_CANGL
MPLIHFHKLVVISLLYTYIRHQRAVATRSSAVASFCSLLVPSLDMYITKAAAHRETILRDFTSLRHRSDPDPQNGRSTCLAKYLQSHCIMTSFNILLRPLSSHWFLMSISGCAEWFLSNLCTMNTLLAPPFTLVVIKSQGFQLTSLIWSMKAQSTVLPTKDRARKVPNMALELNALESSRNFSRIGIRSSNKGREGKHRDTITSQNSPPLVLNNPSYYDGGLIIIEASKEVFMPKPTLDPLSSYFEFQISGYGYNSSVSHCHPTLTNSTYGFSSMPCLNSSEHGNNMSVAEFLDNNSTSKINSSDSSSMSVYVRCQMMKNDFSTMEFAVPLEAFHPNSVFPSPPDYQTPPTAPVEESSSSKGELDPHMSSHYYSTSHV